MISVFRKVSLLFYKMNLFKKTKPNYCIVAVYIFSMLKLINLWNFIANTISLINWIIRPHGNVYLLRHIVDLKGSWQKQIFVPVGLWCWCKSYFASWLGRKKRLTYLHITLTRIISTTIQTPYEEISSDQLALCTILKLYTLREKTTSSLQFHW